MANGVDGVLGGTTTHDAMLWYVTKLLPEYENDPVYIDWLLKKNGEEGIL